MKTYSKLVGYFTGLSWMFSPYSLPFVMYKTGFVVSVCTMAVVSVVSFIPVLWLLETMARAEVTSFQLLIVAPNGLCT